MQNLILSQIPVDELVKKLADELEARALRIPSNETIQPDEDDRLIGDAAAAEYLGCTVQTIIALRKRKEIPYYRYGRRYSYRRSQLDQALKVDERRFGEFRGRDRRQK